MTWRDADGERRWGESDESWHNERYGRAEKRGPYIPEIPGPQPCSTCGRTFAPRIAYIQRCPDCCRRTNELLGRAPAKIDTKPCAICGATFTGLAHWRRCNECRKAGRLLAQAHLYRAQRVVSVDELHTVGVSVRAYGLLACDRCGTTWEALARAGEPLSSDYWRCPQGCNAKGGTP